MGTIATRTLYGFDGQMVATRTPAGLYYLHGDHLGSVSLVSSAGTPGSLVSAQDFDPWGQVRGTGTMVGRYAPFGSLVRSCSSWAACCSAAACPISRS
ncbi:MAG: hypothetical protein ACR2M0_12790 [Chloroflexia bacterium]